MRIQDLYFGVVLPSTNEGVNSDPVNLFDLGFIRYYVREYNSKHKSKTTK